MAKFFPQPHKVANAPAAQEQKDDKLKGDGKAADKVAAEEKKPGKEKDKPGDQAKAPGKEDKPKSEPGKAQDRRTA